MGQHDEKERERKKPPPNQVWLTCADSEDASWKINEQKNKIKLITFKKEKHLITRGTLIGEGTNQQPESIVHRGGWGVGGYMIHIQMTFKRQEVGLPDSQALLIGAFQHD